MAQYGQAIRAIELVQGWRRTYIGILVIAAICLSASITALTTLATHDLNCGLAAGSYSAAIIAVVLAFFTLLSSVF